MNNVKSRMKIAYGRCRPTNGVAAFLFLAISLFILQSCGSSCEETREAYLVAELENESGATLSAINVWGLGQQATYVETLADTVTTWNEVTGEVYDTIIYTRVLVLFPECRSKDDKDREQFQTSHKHQESTHPLSEIGQHAP